MLHVAAPIRTATGTTATTWNRVAELTKQNAPGWRGILKSR
jgi:hypothetical protein